MEAAGSQALNLLQKVMKKLLVWMNISRKENTELFIAPGLAINQDIYKEKCILQRLIPFIKKYHSQDQIIFWPDLASAHYAETVCDTLIEEKIDFISEMVSQEGNESHRS